jgi:pyridoxal phosphate enzyme (YggS family)
VTLVAVSKTQPAEAIRQAYLAGVRDFGENYAQEWKAKADALADLVDLRWHFVGSLQSNKVKTLVGRAGGVAGITYVHAVDREDLARELSRRFAAAGRPVRVFLEVNTGGEATKGGCTPEEAPRLAEAVRALPAVELVGLMCLPPPGQDPRPHFRTLRGLRDRLGLAELSMGMSGDWEVAVAEGATFVRIGTALFGERPPRR